MAILLFRSKRYYLIITFCYLGLFVSCSTENEPDQLTPITQIGAGTFSCLKNSVVWLPHESSLLGGDSKSASIYFNSLQDTTLYITAYKREVGFEAVSEYIDITLRHFHTNKTIYSISDGILDVTFQRDTQNYLGVTGTVNLSLIDTSKMIVSGTFSFATFSKELLDSIQLTDGRFDLIYRKK